MGTNQRELREIEAETQYVKLERLLLVPIVIAFAVLAMVSMVSVMAPILAGISQALQHAAAVPR